MMAFLTSVISVYRARESITLGNSMMMSTGKNLTFETPMLMMSDQIQTAAGTEIMITPFVCDVNE